MHTRIKALCLLGQLGDPDFIPPIRNIVLDYADSFTRDLVIPLKERNRPKGNVRKIAHI